MSDPTTDPLPPRHVPVLRARKELGRFLDDLSREHGLTPWERVMLLAEEASNLAALGLERERRQ